MERSQWLYSGMDYFDAASGGPSPAAAGFLRTLLQSNDGDCSDNDEVITTRSTPAALPPARASLAGILLFAS
eukprot:scaffold7929_cov309-Prasinococcus_capsulatus_cf.AAC.2